MQPFSFHSVADVKSAGKNYQDASSTQFLAGGTTLIDLMKLHVMTPANLIDLSQLSLHKISETKDSIQVDALVSNNEMAEHPLIRSHFPAVSEALLSGASVQLRNLATTAGNILQRTRCAYFRDTSCACNKRVPGSGCSALDGYNRMNAVLGGSDHCIAAHPSDLCVALMALEATIQTEHEGGGRHIAIEDFYRLPGTTPEVENILRPGEVITSIQIPKKTWFKNSRYIKIRDRSSYAFALTSAAVALDISVGVIRDARVAVGGVGTIPWRAKNVEAALIGQSLTLANYQKAAALLTTDAQPRKYNAFKIPLVQQTLVRAIQEAGALV